MEASFYRKTEKGKVQCLLCPHNCILKEGMSGICGIRKQSKGILTAEMYGFVSALSVDPVEKKPLYHFFPGKKILSIGSYGCNLNCQFCQNYNISQSTEKRKITDHHNISPESLIHEAKKSRDNIGIAFTYNEPIIWFEFMKDIAELAKHNKQHTAMVSNGYVNKEPLQEILSFIDAFNIDLKAFNNSFYKKYTGATIKPVLETLTEIQKAGKHLEITYLLIPGLNDNPKEFSNAMKWVSENLGRNTILHLSRYFPSYKLTTTATPVSALEHFALIARESLDYVYIGNAHTINGRNTNCPRCGLLVTERTGYHTKHINLSNDGKCKGCDSEIYHFF